MRSSVSEGDERGPRVMQRNSREVRCEKQRCSERESRFRSLAVAFCEAAREHHFALYGFLEQCRGSGAEKELFCALQLFPGPSRRWLVMTPGAPLRGDSLEDDKQLQRGCRSAVKVTKAIGGAATREGVAAQASVAELLLGASEDCS